jgi:hypothetical protein
MILCIGLSRNDDRCSDIILQGIDGKGKVSINAVCGMILCIGLSRNDGRILIPRRAVISRYEAIAHTAL